MIQSDLSKVIECVQALAKMSNTLQSVISYSKEYDFTEDELYMVSHYLWKTVDRLCMKNDILIAQQENGLPF